VLHGIVLKVLGLGNCCGGKNAMNDRQLKYILTLAEEHNMSNAAQKLYISQPSLSSMLASVEDELGVKIFERRSTHMTLTSAGQCYIEASKNILRIMRDLERQINECNNYTRGTITIGCGRCRTNPTCDFGIKKMGSRKCLTRKNSLIKLLLS
jgi:DNA-binding MarR family transcriptional regulator